MKKSLLFFVFLVLLGIGLAHAQTVRITGTVTSSDDGLPIPGVSVIVKGTTNGVATNVDGKYELNVGSNDQTLVFSFVGYTTQEIAIGGRSIIDVALQSESLQVEELVVTALGIKREKKSLGYAVSEVSGDKMSNGQNTNAVSALSGRVSGVDIKSSGNMGGSANVVIRGGSSLTKNNQALFVVDGIPISNRSVNSTDTQRGGGGYDFGNAASDINPEDIETVSVLKGASATALYGARGGNGVILITTKKAKQSNRIGVSVNSSITIDKINLNTMPTYQKEYGGGGSMTFPSKVTIEGNLYQRIRYDVDESWGPKFDETIQVLPWNALDKTDPSRYLKTVPWVAAKNGPEAFFEIGKLYMNSVALEGSNDKGNFRVSFTNTDQEGTMPNQSLIRNNVSVNGMLKLSDRLSTSVTSQFVNTKTIGRPGTGYDSAGALSFMATSGMWMQTNVDYLELKDYLTADGAQKTWNRRSVSNASPQYWDNPYWTRYKNYENDERNRVIGSWSLDYKIADWISATGRVSIDRYDFLMELRTAKGSLGEASYSKTVNLEQERNLDFMLNINKNITKDINISGLVGTGRRDNTFNSTGYNTVSGLIMDDYWSIDNTGADAIGRTDLQQHSRVNSIYGQTSIGYKSMVYLDLSARQDWSSTLPKENCDYFYPSVSTSFIFSELMNKNILNFGKVRVNYAEVGNDADFGTIYKEYNSSGIFNSLPLFSEQYGRNNPNLKPERSKTFEIGLDLKFLNNRIGLDASYYNKTSTDLIMRGSISSATGHTSQWMNAGKMTNKGVELTLYLTPVKLKDFTWDMQVNWSKNVNEVVELVDGVDLLQIGSNGVKVCAKVGAPYGVIIGTDYVYDALGNKVVGPDGTYLKTDADQVLGNFNPEWKAGFTNSFKYKRITLSALIDFSMGGELYSLTHAWGTGTGIFPISVGLNDLGNPKRNPVSEGGGLVLEGVAGDLDANGEVVTTGEMNAVRISARAALNDGNHPDKAYVYDASYIKLRQVSISYDIPTKLCSKLGLAGISVGFVGKNLAIIHKGVDYIDPEQTYGASNMQGIETGSLPTTRSYGFNLKFNF